MTSKLHVWLLYTPVARSFRAMSPNERDSAGVSPLSPPSQRLLRSTLHQAVSTPRAPCSVRKPSKTCVLCCGSVCCAVLTQSLRPQRATEFSTKRKALNEQFTRRAAFLRAASTTNLPLAAHFAATAG